MTPDIWMAAARGAARTLRATTVGTRGAKHSVYVVLLHNPTFLERWGLYVGQTSRDPDWRFDYGREFGDWGTTKWLNLAGGRGFHGERFHVMRRVGKIRAGRLLDGVEHNAMPEVRP